MRAPSLCVQVDGGPGAGAGHLGRCLALVQAWIDWGGTATLVSSALPAHWSARFGREGVALVEAAQPMDGDADWAVLDGYRFGNADVDRLRGFARRVLVIDDHGIGGDRGADLVVDQNLGAVAAPYASEALLGTRYAMLRRDFRAFHRAHRAAGGRARQLLVTLGGSPPDDVVVLVDGALREPAVRDLEVTVLQGVEQVAAAMAEADLALSASGSTSWELCCVGLPALLLPTAANQEPVATALRDRGAAAFAGLPDDLTPAGLATALSGLAGDDARRAEMATVGPELVDGRGARRVATRMRADLLVLRAAREEDARLLWEWANDPVVRASAFDERPIAWDTHVEWLRRRLADTYARIYIALAPDGAPLGQVRFEGDNDVVEISLSVSREFRGRGWGPALIDAGSRRVFADTAASTICARVKGINKASRSAFHDADFTQVQSPAPDQTRHVRHRRAQQADHVHLQPSEIVR
jgi:UDP-2,4-diacetamido-2,4,6-trideoxy-beta-L-altropyranose hydrolase